MFGKLLRKPGKLFRRSSSKMIASSEQYVASMSAARGQTYYIPISKGRLFMTSHHVFRNLDFNNEPIVSFKEYFKSETNRKT